MELLGYVTALFLLLALAVLISRSGRVEDSPCDPSGAEQPREPTAMRAWVMLIPFALVGTLVVGATVSVQLERRSRAPSAAERRWAQHTDDACRAMMAAYRASLGRRGHIDGARELVAAQRESVRIQASAATRIRELGNPPSKTAAQALTAFTQKIRLERDASDELMRGKEDAYYAIMREASGHMAEAGRAFEAAGASACGSLF